MQYATEHGCDHGDCPAAAKHVVVTQHGGLQFCSHHVHAMADAIEANEYMTAKLQKLKGLGLELP